MLVTGFGPFMYHKVNASWEAVKEMSSLGLQHNGDEVKLVTREIPVVYEVVSKVIPELCNEIKPTLCVHVGVSPHSCVKLEKFGRNESYNMGDINSCLPPDNVCCKGGLNKLRTVFNVNEILKCVSQKQADVVIEVSEDAGRYLCDFIYYTSLYHNGSVPVLFIHVPILNKPYSKEQLGRLLKNIVETLLIHIEEGKITNDYEIH